MSESILAKFIRNRSALKRGQAHRVVFYYFGEEPTYLEDVYVSIFRNGMVEILHKTEHVSTHIQNVEILWKHPKRIPLGKRPLTLVKSDLSKM